MIVQPNGQAESASGIASLAFAVTTLLLLDSFSQLTLALWPIVSSDPAWKYTGLRLVLTQTTPWIVAATIVGAAIAQKERKGQRLLGSFPVAYLTLAVVALALTIAFLVVSADRAASLPATQLALHRKTVWQGTISGACLTIGLAGFGMLLRPSTRTVGS